MPDTLSQLPNVLILTDNSLSLNHGTGTSLLRHFADYPPEKLLNVFSFLAGEPAFEQSCRIRPKLLPGLAMKTVAALGGNQTALHSRLETCALQRPIRDKIEKMGFVPDIIYAVCFGLRGFLMLSRLAEEYGPDVPIILHFFDYQRYGNDDVAALIEAVSPSVTEVWSLTTTMAEEISQVMNRSVELVRIFHTELPAVYKETHRAFSADFSAVMIGNCWIPELLADVRAAWRAVGEIVGGLQPIKWYSHPATIEKLRRANIQFEPEIEFCGFVQGELLFHALQQADIAIIPFNRESTPENDYARFSLPSRITEMASAGLPIFCVAGPQTEIEKYITEKGIGVCTLPDNQQRFQQVLLAFMQDKAQRTSCGFHARQLAIDEFNLNQYQAWFYRKLATSLQKPCRDLRQSIRNNANRDHLL